MNLGKSGEIINLLSKLKEKGKMHRFIGQNQRSDFESNKIFLFLLMVYHKLYSKTNRKNAIGTKFIYCRHYWCILPVDTTHYVAYNPNESKIHS